MAGNNLDTMHLLSMVGEQWIGPRRRRQAAPDDRRQGRRVVTGGVAAYQVSKRRYRLSVCKDGHTQNVRVPPGFHVGQAAPTSGRADPAVSLLLQKAPSAGVLVGG
jgi:hypothetical protein